MNKKQILITAATLGMSGIILGALGAHALEGKIDPEQIVSFKTAVRYQVWHALALLFLFSVDSKNLNTKKIAIFWTIGVLLFSGSIYFLSLRDLINLPLSWLGPVTPLGGLLMIFGWFLLFLSAFRLK